MNCFYRFGVLFLALFLLTNKMWAQDKINWTPQQTIQPAKLAEVIRSGESLPVLISIGPAARIPGSVNIGMVNTPEGLKKLNDQLKTLKRNQQIVVYCGCCPYEHCPNVRPAIEALKGLKFTNFFFLDLPSNLKKDWIDKGYPVVD